MKKDELKMTSLVKLTDEELVACVVETNSSMAFRFIYDRYHKKVLDKCYGFVKSRDKAIELAEEIFTKTFVKLPTFKFNSSFSSWLYSITYNYCIDYLREKKKLHYPNWNRDHEIPEIIDANDEDIELYEYDKLVKILEIIHPEEKALILMKYWDNLSLKQISISLRISEDAAKMRLKRARTRIVYLYKTQYLVSSTR
jgi:RNA polymerase sigma factor (sigma-70 family)